MIFKRLIKWWQSLRLYVIADPADNSVTLSKALFRHIKNNAREGDPARVFVFSWGYPYGKRYAFMVNPDIDQPTQMCDIQYNDKYRCIGFETLCPSVGKIFYDYNLPASGRIKLSVSLRKTGHGKVFYQFDRPHAKHIRKYSNG